MPLTHSDVIVVKKVKGKGRGVFAARPIRDGQEIERVPVLVLPIREVQSADDWTELASYCFVWGEGTVALALGYGSLYNHSYRPNARYYDVGARTKQYVAVRDIAEGEEITINYNGDPDDHEPVGFDVVEDAPPEPSPAKARARAARPA